VPVSQWRPDWLAATESVGTEIRFELPREFLPELAKSVVRDVSSVSCAFETLQLWQGFRQIVSTGRAELHQVLRGVCTETSSVLIA
jgi:hypothetical protein